jgi:hypothetical protein
LALHSADTQAPFQKISLSELLRVVQFFNGNGLHCASGTEDGYAPGPGAQTCAAHSSDYNPSDWRVNLSELLRLIQFYNLDGYHGACGSEDGFAPGPGVDCSGEGEGEATPLPDLGVNANMNGWRPFADDDEWNRDVSGDAVATDSGTVIASVGASTSLRLDLGTTGEYYGIPYVVVPGTQPLVPISFGTDGANYSDESDLGPFPVPLDAPIEGGSTADPNPASGDRHVLVIDRDHMMLYELYNTERVAGGFRVSSSAKFDLTAKNNTRPAGWTSADAGGMPIFPGLVRFDEVAGGEIRHALRLTVPHVRKAYTYPGNHFGPSLDTSTPIYGQRFRLNASFDESGYSARALVIIHALKTYGLIVADQGSAWYITGVSNPGWKCSNPRLRWCWATDGRLREVASPWTS